MIKRFLTTGSLISVLFLINNVVFASHVVFTDEIPQSHIQSVENINNTEFDTVPSNFATRERTVNIYSDKKIMPVPEIKVINGTAVYTQNIKINDKIQFYTSEDVMKNGKLYIRAQTPVVGTVRTAQICYVGYLNALPGEVAPSKFEIFNFKTKDVNGNNVDLYGKVVSFGHNTGIFASLSGIPTTEAIIKKNKIYTLYYK